ncbi:MAG TPA: hypothetical protein VFH36_22520 [Acidimicrobiales bacterium]|nr:hypothetical protein [Acidimicrobiales bacterium]
MPVDPELAHLRAQKAANTRWSRPGERQRHGDKIAAAKLARHERLVDPDGRLAPAERRKLARNSLKAEMAGLALAGAKARRSRTAVPQ